MSIHVLSWVLKHSPVDEPRARLVLVVIADHADDEGCNSFPKRATIAHEARLPERTVGDRLAALEQGGHIEEMGRTGYNNRTVIWRVVMAEDQRKAIRQGVPDSKRAQSGTPAPDQSGTLAPDSRVEASKGTVRTVPDGSDVQGWERVRAQMRSDGINDFIDHVWLEPLQPLEVRPGLIRLGAPRSHYGWVRERYLDGIAATAAAIAGRPVEVELVPMNEAAPDAAGRQAPGADQR